MIVALASSCFAGDVSRGGRPSVWPRTRWMTNECGHLCLRPPPNVSSMRLGCVHTCTHSCPLVIGSLRRYVGRWYQMWKASKSGTSGFSLLKWWSFPSYTSFRWETPLLHSCMRLSWPYFTLRLAGTLKDFPPSIYTLSLSHTSALPGPDITWRDRLFMIF